MGTLVMRKLGGGLQANEGGVGERKGTASQQGMLGVVAGYGVAVGCGPQCLPAECRIEGPS